MKWNITAKKNVGPITFFAQAASDHFRTITFDARPSYEPIVDRVDEWYYMIRMQFGL